MYIVKQRVVIIFLQSLMQFLTHQLEIVQQVKSD